MSAHRATIERIGGDPAQDLGRPYFACFCGVCGRPRKTEAEAEADRDAHLRAVEKQAKASAR